MISCREYAKRRGVSAMAVSLAIKSGRLSKSVIRDSNGSPKITDVALANQEWEANTSHEHRERAMGPPADAPAPDPDNPTAHEGMTKSEADAVAAVWKARHIELDFKAAAGELVPVADVSRRLVDEFTRAKTKLLGLPSRARQALPHLTVADIAALESIVREALEGLAE